MSSQSSPPMSQVPYTAGGFVDPHAHPQLSRLSMQGVQGGSSTSVILPKSATSYTTVKSATQLEGRLWKSDWTDIPGLILSILLLAMWLSAALALIIKKQMLPLNYFDKQSSKFLADGNYNTLIAVASNLLAAVICYGVALGFKNAIRARILSTEGISMRRYDLLCHLAGQTVQWRASYTALIALLLFGLCNQFGAATQAAFGYSLVKTNITVNFPLARLSDNKPFVSIMTGAGSNSGLGPGMLGEIRDALTSAVEGLDEGSGGSSVIRVNDVRQAVGSGPAMPFILHSAILSNNNDTATDLHLSADKRKLLQANIGSNSAYAPTEGFSVNATCQNVVLDPPMQRLGTLVQVDFNVSACAEGATLKYYDGSLPRIIDTYACQDGSPNIYIFDITQTNTSVSLCTLSGSSAIYPAVVSQQGVAGRALGQGVNSTSLPFVGDIVKLSGSSLWNTFGPTGSQEMLTAYAAVQQWSNVPTGLQLAQISTIVVTVSVLAKIADLLALNAVTVEATTLLNIQSSVHRASYQVQALKLHLDGVQLAWFALPALLLILCVLLLVTRAIKPHSGAVDFSDPLSVLLIALQSPQDNSYRGCSTGQFAKDSDMEHFAAFFGVDPHDQDRLILTGSSGKVDAHPVYGKRYV